MEQLICYTSCMLEFISFYYIIKSFFHTTLKPEWKDIIACVLITLLSANADVNAILSFFLFPLLYILYIFLVLSRNIKNALFLYLVSAVLFNIVQTLVSVLIGLMNLDITASYIPYLGNIATIAFSILFFRVPFISQLYNTILNASFPYRIILLNIYLLLRGYLLISKLNGVYSYLGYHAPVFAFVFILLIVTINFCLIYYEHLLSNKQQELHAYQINMPIYESLIHEIRGQQHEYSNHIQALGNLPIICEDYDSLCKALSGYTTSYTHALHVYPLLQVNMPLLAASLYHLAIKAENEGIQVHFDITTRELRSHAPEYQLSDLVCILTQNAIEACNPGEHVYVHISSEQGRVEFEIRNPVSKVYSTDELERFFRKNYSTKKKTNASSSTPHGYGLYTLRKKLLQYNGTIGMDCVEFNHKNWIIFHLIV